MTRGQHLARVFVELADTLVAEFDVIDFLHTLTERCVELLGADAAGLMLADQRGQLRVIASSAESARLMESFELQTSEGPCLDCFRTGRQVVNSTTTRCEPGGRISRQKPSSWGSGQRMRCPCACVTT